MVRHYWQVIKNSLQVQHTVRDRADYNQLKINKDLSEIAEKEKEIEELILKVVFVLLQKHGVK